MNKFSSPLDSLIDTDNEILHAKYPDLLELKKQVLLKIKELTLGLKDSSLTIPEYLDSLKNFASQTRKDFDREIFSEIYVDDKIDSDAVDRLLDYFNKAISLVHPSLLNSISNVTLVVKADKENQFFSNFEKNVISLTISEDTNMLLLVAVLVHEVIHLIEYHNKNVNELAHSFIDKRAVAVGKAKFKKGFNCSDVIAYDLKMDDPHSGVVYSNSLTEVLTTGVQNFILAPAMILFKDVEYLETLNKFFKLKELKD